MIWQYFDRQCYTGVILNVDVQNTNTNHMLIKHEKSCFPLRSIPMMIYILFLIRQYTMQVYTKIHKQKKC